MPRVYSRFKADFEVPDKVIEDLFKEAKDYAEKVFGRHFVTAAHASTKRMRMMPVRIRGSDGVV